MTRTTTWENWNATQQDDYMSDYKQAYMLTCEIDREEALELIEWYAKNGRVNAALDVLADEIEIHLENEPCDGEWLTRCHLPRDGWEKSITDWDDYREDRIKRHRASHDVWKAGLDKLNALREQIPLIAAEAMRKRPQYERERLARFNEVFHNERDV
jgi:hypothetical protein